MGVAYWVEQMAADVDEEMKERQYHMLMDQLNSFENMHNAQAPKRDNTWI